MSYILIEVRGQKIPVINALEEDQIELLLENLDVEFEIILRSDGTKHEVFNFENKSWEQIPKI